MDHKAIFMIASHGLYIRVSLIQVCVVYVHVVKEVVPFLGGWSINGMACNRTHTRALQTSRKQYLKHIPKVLQGPLKGKASR